MTISSSACTGRNAGKLCEQRMPAAVQCCWLKHQVEAGAGAVAAKCIARPAPQQQGVRLQQLCSALGRLATAAGVPSRKAHQPTTPPTCLAAASPATSAHATAGAVSNTSLSTCRVDGRPGEQPVAVQPPGAARALPSKRRAGWSGVPGLPTGGCRLQQRLPPTHPLIELLILF